MNIQYKILWVEDTKSFVDSKSIFIKNFLEERGFSLQLENPEKYKSYNFSEFDLIIVDYNLASNELGENVIKKIREEELYTEILFYSRIGKDKLLKLLAQQKLEGVYCASRDSFEERVIGLINTTIRKTQDLNNLRGLVMAETSELDEMMRKILELLFQKEKIETSKISRRFKRIEDYYTDCLDGNTRENIKGVKEFVHPDEFLELLKSRHFTSRFTFRTLCSFSGCSKNDLQKKNISSYGEDIIKMRNDLAHQAEFEKLIDSDFIKIRQNIQKYKEIFQEIIQDLNP